MKSKTYSILSSRIIIAAFFLFLSCKANIDEESSTTSEGAFTVKLDKDVSEYPEIKKVEILDIIQLETKEESLLGTISKVQQVDDQWFVSSMSKLFVFNSRGEFIHTIGEIGNGPGEISEVMDFWIDSDQKQIVILDTSGRKIVIFNLNGEFQKEIGINSFPQGIAKSNS